MHMIQLKPKDLLRNTGYTEGFSTKLYFRDAVRSFLPDPMGVATEVKMQLKDNLNIDVELIPMEISRIF